MKAVEILLIAVLAAAAVGAVIWMIRRRGAGCCCGCGGCKRSAHCARRRGEDGDQSKKINSGKNPKEKES